MKQPLKLLLCLMIFFCTNDFLQSQADINFEILDQLIMQSENGDGDTRDPNGDTRDPNGGLSGGGSGGGGSNIKIFTDWPNEGKMIIADSKLSWNDKGVKPPFKVQITDENGREIFSKTTDKNEMLLDLSKMPLSEDKNYKLVVTNDKFSSKESSFTIVSNDEFTTLIKEVKENPDFKSASKFRKTAMKAFALEVRGFNYDAYKRYLTYMFDDKDDKTLRNMRDRFRKEYNIK